MRKTEAICHAQHMAINRKCWNMKSLCEYHARGFSADAWQSLKLLKLGWHFTTEFFNEHTRCIHDTFRFRPIKPG